MIFTSNSVAFAQKVPSSQDSKANVLIATQENSVNVPGNVTVMAANSVTYESHNGIDWPEPNHRYCWQETLAKQGKTYLDSYSRARFEHAWWQGGSVYCDSGRCWSVNQGFSYAQSGKEKYDTLESGVAKTYYGISNK